MITLTLFSLSFPLNTFLRRIMSDERNDRNVREISRHTKLNVGKREMSIFQFSLLFCRFKHFSRICHTTYAFVRDA